MIHIILSMKLWNKILYKSIFFTAYYCFKQHFHNAIISLSQLIKEKINFALRVIVKGTNAWK